MCKEGRDLVNKMKSWTSIGHPQCFSPEASYPPNNREKRPLLAGNCQQALRGALKAGLEKKGELATTSLLWNLNSTFSSLVVPRRLSCQIFPPIGAKRKRALM